MRRPELFDLFTLGIFWCADKKMEDELMRQHNAEKALELKEREVEALEKLVKSK